MDYLQTIIMAIISLQLLWVCYTDIRFRLITNSMVLMVMVTAIILGLITNKPNTLYALLASVYPALIILTLGFFVFCLRIIGGGDIKLMAALALALNVPQSVNFVLFSSIFGAVVAVVGMVISYSAMRAKGVPYGVAITMGFLLVIYSD